MIMMKNNTATNELIFKIRRLANLNGVGELRLIAALINDLKLSQDIFSIELPIIHILNNILVELAPVDVEKKINQDGIAANAINNFNLNILTLNPSTKYGPAGIEKIRAVRGLVVYFHLITNIEISKKLLNAINQILRCKDLSQIYYFEELSLDVEILAKQYDGLTQENPLKKIYATLVAYFNLQNKSVNLTIENGLEIKKVKVAEVKLDSKLQHPFDNTQDSTKSEVIPKVSLHYDDFLRYRLKQYSQSPRQQSGVFNLNKHLHPIEFRDFLRIVSNDFLTSNGELHLAVLLTVFIGVNIANFHFIHFKKTVHQNLWIDLARGQICYNRNFIIRKEEPPTDKDIFRVPLPKELSSKLTKMYALKNAENLRDLFQTDIQLLNRQARKYCFNKSLTSHIASLTRLGNSYSRFLLSLCSDEIFSSVISVDYSIAERANMNYFVAKHERLNQICTDAYVTLGFSGQLFTPVDEDIGSVLGISSDQILELLRHVLTDANQALQSLTTRSNEKALVEIQGKVSKAALILTVISGGLRTSKFGYIANHQIDFENGYLVISDKDNSDYNLWRIVPLATLSKKWLITHQNFLQVLAKRLSNKNKKLSTDIAELALSNGVSVIPPFFKIDKHKKIHTLTSKDIRKIFKDYGLETNASRHTTDFSLRSAVGNVLINSFMGRASLGQESFGARSCLSLEFAFNQFKLAMDEYFTHAQLPLPIPFSGYKYLSKMHQSNDIYRTQLAKKRDTRVKQSNAFEECPFYEFTILHSKYFDILVQKWKSQAPEFTIGDLSISVVANDGVSTFNELIEVVWELIGGKIYILGDEYTLDVEINGNGKRRIYLSADTLLILNGLVQKRPDTSNLNKEQIAKLIVLESFSTLTKFHENGYELQPSIKDFLKSASAYFSLILPAMLRSWGDGKILARTNRIETLARHTKNKPEPEIFAVEKSAKHRRVDSDREIINLLLKYSSNTETLGSNQKRMKNLKKEIESSYSNLYLSEDRILAKFLLYLINECASIESPSTIKNHYFTVRSLLSDLPNYFYETEEIDEIRLKNYLKINSKLTSSNTVSLNYFMKMLGINLRVKATNKPPKPYSELLSINEIRIIKTYILSSKNEPMVKLQAAGMLELLSTSAIRHEDITKLRVCDVFIGNPSYVYLTRKSVGTKKNRNADRVIIDEHNEWQNLAQLVAIAQKLGPSNKKTAIFAAPHNLSSFKHADLLMALISAACKKVTGAISVRPHTFRNSNISNAILDGCSLSSQQDRTPLSLRLLAKELSVAAGHGDEITTISEYCSCMDKLRREWMNYIYTKFIPHPFHLAALIDKNVEVTSRNLKVKSSQSLMHQQLKKLADQIKKRTVPVEHFLSSEKNISEDVDGGNEEFKYVARTRYVAASALDLDEDVIRYLVNLDATDYEYLKECLETYNAAVNIKWTASAGETDILTLDKAFNVVQQNIATLTLTKKDIYGFSHAFSSDLCTPWVCNRNELQTIIDSKIIERLFNAGYEAILTVVKHFDSQAFSFRNDFHFVETSNASQFGGKKPFKISFVPVGTKPAARPRKLQLAMLTVTSCLVAHLSFQLGV